MDTQAFDILEQKVSQVLERLNKLRSENDELRTQVQEWEARYKEAVDKLEDVGRERDKFADNQRDGTKEELIRRKVEELLSRLEAA